MARSAVGAVVGPSNTLNVTADLLVFDNNERGPDDDLRLAF